MFELLNTLIQKDDGPDLPTGLPGPAALITGNKQIGFFGEVAPADFISYGDLATLVGITVGTNQYPTGEWLKLAYNGNVQYFPKLPARTAVPWATLNTLGAVNGKEVTIRGKTYKVRLINGSNTSPYPGSGNDDTGNAYGTNTEWSKLIYGLASATASVAGQLEGPALATYTLTQLGFDTGNGRSTIIKEITTTNLQLARGNAQNNIRGLYPYSGLTNTDAVRGWRPVVEYVSG